MPKLQVFDPAMCCSTGVCGPSVDPAFQDPPHDLEVSEKLAGSGSSVKPGPEVAAFTSRLNGEANPEPQGEQVSSSANWSMEPLFRKGQKGLDIFHISSIMETCRVHKPL